MVQATQNEIDRIQALINTLATGRQYYTTEGDIAYHTRQIENLKRPGMSA